MLIVELGCYELYSHYMQDTLGYDEDDLVETAKELGAKDEDEFLKLLAEDLQRRYQAGVLTLDEGDVGNGSFYPGNKGHSEMNINFKFGDEALDKLDDYFNSLQIPSS